MSTTETRRADVAEVVKAARALIEAHESRSPTSENATLGELDALFRLRWVLGPLHQQKKAS